MYFICAFSKLSIEISYITMSNIYGSVKVLIIISIVSLMFAVNLSYGSSDGPICMNKDYIENKYKWPEDCKNDYKDEMSDARERTFIMIKPDGVQRGLVGKIIERFEQKGFKLVAMKFMWPSKSLLEQHYADLSSKPFFPSLIQYMSSGPVVPMVWEGLNVVKTGRVMLGATDPKDSAPGTIRGDFCIQVGRNIIHGSDAIESANKEINMWFKSEELTKWERENEKWIYEF